MATDADPAGEAANELDNTTGSTFLDYLKVAGGIFKEFQSTQPGPVAAAPQVTQITNFKPILIVGGIVAVILVLFLVMQRR